jgi:hypothetical protein
MTPEERRNAARERMKQRIKRMRAITAHTVESCDADGVVLIVSFSDPHETSVRMSTWGNGVLVSEMVKAARRTISKGINRDD